MNEAENTIGELMDKFGGDLLNDDEMVISQTTTTNASPFDVSNYEVVEAEFTDEGKQEIDFITKFTFVGDQDEDKPFCGDTVSAVVRGTATGDGFSWEIKDYEIEECQVGDYNY